MTFSLFSTYLQQSDEIAKFSYRWYDIVACNGLWVQAIGKPVYKIGNVPKLFNLSFFSNSLTIYVINIYILINIDISNKVVQKYIIGDQKYK